MFAISSTLMQQCIDMVAKEQDYIPLPDGLEADYCVYNIPGDGVWIVEPWATEGGDYIKVQEIVLPAPNLTEAGPVVYGGVMHEVKRNY